MYTYNSLWNLNIKKSRRDHTDKILTYIFKFDDMSIDCVIKIKNKKCKIILNSNLLHIARWEEAVSL